WMTARSREAIFHAAAMETKPTSTFFALRNPVFLRLWLASVLSGTFVSAQDLAATWLMHDLGASSLSLSLMATAASAPFFLLTLPAGAVADIANRRTVIVSAVLWQGAGSAVLAAGAWMGVIHPNAVLACIFAIGIGLAFSAPVWGAIVPDIVSKEELPSAITLGGVQLNLSGIVGPALGGFLLPLLGPPLLITVNALTFVVVALAVLQWKPRETQSTGLRESFTESFISSLRYARNSHRMRVILFRNLLFSLVISIVPALLPVIALREMQLSASQLGLVFTCVGVGSLVGAVFVLPYLRERISPNAITSVAMVIMIVVLLTWAFMRQFSTLMACAALAGVAWALAGSELWVAGQRVMPGWVRGRMNAFQIMLGQGGIAIGALVWGAGAAHAGLDLTFAGAAVLALAVLALGHRFSIDFAVEASVDAAPLNPQYNFPACPDHDDGPITVTITYAIARADRERFYTLMQEVQASLRRNGAFDCRLDESLHEPGMFRLEFQVSTWAEHLRQTARMTVDERQVFNTAWDLSAADSAPIVHYYLSSQKCVFPQNFGFIGRTFSNTSSLSKRRLPAAASTPAS
ncbi:MAG: MFS transporter, partial [Terrimicrobiaceae bacterium]